METRPESSLVQLGEDTNLLAQIVESSDDAILSKTLDGIITSWNPAASRIFGYAAAEAVGKHISLLIPPDRMSEETEIIRQLKAGQNIDHYETVRLHKSGAAIDVSLSVSPIRDQAGIIVGASKTARDVTERKKAERRLRTLQAELAHVGRLSAMGQMSAAIAHELNQPLTAITNYTNAALRMLDPQSVGPQKLASARDAIEKASGQALRAGMIIRRLREFADKRDAERSAEDLDLIVRDAVSLAFVGMADSAVSVNVEPSPTPLPVLIDRIQIQQVLLNLIRNSIEAMASTPRQRIDIATGSEDGFAWARISDTGPGLPPEVKAKLFQPFVTTKEKGMGIGLAICQSILEAHGGNMHLVPGAQEGAHFCVQLPLFSGSAAQPADP